jgi:hypothetical protein
VRHAILLLIVAVTCKGFGLSVISRVAMATELTWNEESVLDTIQRAIRDCDAYPLPLQRYAPPDKPFFPDDPGNYLKTIQPLLDDHSETVPILEGLRDKDSTSPIEKLVISILLDRIAHPESFETVAPYLSVANDSLSRWHRSMNITDAGKILAVQKIYEPKLIPMRLREDYQIRYAQAIKIQEDWQSRFDQKRTDEQGVEYWGKPLLRGRRRRIAECFDGSAWLGELDPAFLLAWQEGLLRPVPWSVKISIVRHLGQTKEGETSTVLKHELIFAAKATMSRDKAVKEQATHLVDVVRFALLGWTASPEKLKVVIELVRGKELLTSSESVYLAFHSAAIKAFATHRAWADVRLRLVQYKEWEPEIAEFDRLCDEYKNSQPKH